MNDRSYLLKRRRSYILRQRKVRSVSCRHLSVHYDTSAKPVIIEDTPAYQEAVKEEQVVLNVEKKDIEKPLEQPVSKPSVKEETKEEKSEEVKLSRKEKKKQEKEEILNLLIDEPEINLFKMIANPLKCMDEVAELDYATLSSGQRTVMNIFKWLAIGGALAMPISEIIDINPYGFSRMNFTSTSILAFKFALFGFFSEFILFFAISALCMEKGKRTDRARLVSIYTYGAPLEIILFALSAVSMRLNLTCGIALLTASLLASLYMKSYGISKSDLARKRLIFGLILFGFLFVLLFFAYAEFACSDVIKILKNIMNI